MFNFELYEKVKPDMNQRHMPVLLRKLMIPSAVTEISDLQHILDSLDAVVYVSDVETHELLFMNKYALKNIGGVNQFDDVKGKRCFEVLQKGQKNLVIFVLTLYSRKVVIRIFGSLKIHAIIAGTNVVTA